MTQGYALIAPNGRVHGTSRAFTTSGTVVLITNGALFDQVEAASANYAWLDNAIVYAPAEFPWLQWNGSAWVYDAGAHAAYLAYAKAMMWDKIRLHRDALSERGFPANGKWWHNDTISRTRILGLMIMLLAGGGQIPQGVIWKTMSGELVTLTPQIVQLMFQGAATQDVWMFAVAEQHRMAMEAAADPFAYNYAAGWPPVYGE